MSPVKPRPYSGPVDFLDRAAGQAQGWTDATLLAVLRQFPYPPDRGVRDRDWVELVAHVSLTRQEDPVACAQRLALYCHAYAERYSQPPLPETVRRSQDA